MIPTFGLNDIPDDWEIELDDDFVKFLDKVNRPWKYNPDGSYNPKGRHGNRQSAVFWEAGDYYGECQKHLITPEYLRRHHFFVKLWGYHRYHDAHTGRFGYIKKVDTGNWILKSELEVLRETIDMSEADLEEIIVGFRKGKGSTNVRELKIRLPIRGNKLWAWLLGYYFAVGAVVSRKRDGGKYREIRMRAHENVIPLISQILKKLGAKCVVYDRAKCHAIKDKGLGTTARRTVVLGYPEYLVLIKMGLPTDFLEHNPNQSGSRSFNPKIPNWIKKNDKFMTSFIEGFVNGRGQSVLSSIKFQQKLPVPHLSVILRMNGTPEASVKRFLLEIKEWFEKQGIKGYFRKIDYYPVKGQVQYELVFFKKKARKWFIKNLDIKRPDLRARLLIREEADKDPLLYEILRELRTPDNVILGMILEHPRTQRNLENSLQMKKEGIVESLQSLELKGIIRRREQIFYYDPKEFKEKVIIYYEQVRRELLKRYREYSTALLHGCTECGVVYTTCLQNCLICGAEVKPMARDKILSNFNGKLVWNRILLTKLKHSENRKL